MAIRWRPRIVVGDIDLTLSLPARPFDYPNEDIGGSETAGGGIPASYVVREDYMMGVVLRFYESERRSVEIAIREMQGHFTTTRYYADQSVDSYQTCYLESPKRGERWQPTRPDDMAGHFELPIMFRSIVGAWTVQYYGEG